MVIDGDLDKSDKELHIEGLLFRFDRLKDLSNNNGASLSDTQFMWKLSSVLSGFDGLEALDKRFSQILREHFPVKSEVKITTVAGDIMV